MVDGIKAIEIFSKFFPNWKFCVVDSKGFSRGLLFEWNPEKDNLNSFLTPLGIFLEVFLNQINLNLNLLNC